MRDEGESYWDIKGGREQVFVSLAELPSSTLPLTKLKLRYTLSSSSGQSGPMIAPDVIKARPKYHIGPNTVSPDRS